MALAAHGKFGGQKGKGKGKSVAAPAASAPAVSAPAAPGPAGVGAIAAAGSDPKTMLNTFCQKYTRKPIGKNDISYQCVRHGDKMQATVTLNCLGGIQFAGDIAANQKEAENNAARQALETYKDEMANLPQKGVKRKAEGSPLDSWMATADAATKPVNPLGNPSNCRAKLNEAMIKILKRVMTKEDVQYSTQNTRMGFQCTISMPSLPGEWGGLAWAGEVAPKKKDAEENAAKYAYDALLADPTFADLINSVKVAKTEGGKGKGKGKGKEKGKEKGKGKWASFENFVEMYGGWFKGKGWGKGGDWGGRKKEDRQRVGEDLISGTVAEWKGTYGWVTSEDTIEHEAAGARGGKIFLHIKDWQEATGLETPPEVGSAIAGRLYADSAGLGIDEVTSL